MRVRKVRNENRVGKITLSATEVKVASMMGVSIERYTKELLSLIAKKRRWKWYFNKKEVVLGSYGGHHDRIGFVYKDTGLPPTSDEINRGTK